MIDFQQKTVTLTQAVTLLLEGAVGVLPTDTVYGLVARALDETATERLYALKNRHHKPGTIIAASIAQLNELGVSSDTIERIKDLWPNPFSIILPVGDKVRYLHQGVGDIAIRVVSDDSLKAFLEQTGPLLTSSANHPGKPGSITIEEAMDYFGDQVDFYVDGGNLSARLPSTIARLHSHGHLEILRQGAFSVPNDYTSGKN